MRERLMKKQNRREFIKIMGLGTAAFTVPGCTAPEAKERKKPNILFIMTDDHAVQAVGCYGSRINKTPQIDRLAAGGVRFDLAFCTNAICAPSRAVLLTGKYSHLNGQVDNAVPFDGSQQTFTKLLKYAGYETALFGKWHLKSRPEGFDYHAILPGQGDYYNPVFIEMGVKKQRTGYVTDLITDQCLEWLKNRKGDKPFCVLLHQKAPHRNWMPGPKHLDLYEGEEIPVPENYFDDYATRGDAARQQEMTVAHHAYPAYDLKLTPETPQSEETPREQQDRRMWERIYGRLNEEQQALWEAAYGPRNERFRKAGLEGRELDLWKYQRYIKDYLRCIASVDDNIGRVLDYLDATGLAEDTLVVYTSDQGFFLGEHGWFDKRFMYEESLRMPLIIRYPREIRPGVNDRDLVLNLDFAPTFLDFAGVQIPGDLQGASLKEVLKGESPDGWRQAIYYHYYEYPGAHGVKRHYGVRTHRYKLIHFYYDIDAWELYDLEKDPREMNNVYGDPEYAGVVQELKAELARLRRQYGDTNEAKFLPAKAIRCSHKGLGKPVSLKHPYSPRYPASGPGALTDGALSPVGTFHQANYLVWQGFEQNDLEAVVDLGILTPVYEVTAGFLQNAQDWIFLPLSVEFALSRDGMDFTPIRKIQNDIPQKKEGVFKHRFWSRFDGGQARYVLVKAKNIGVCPPWHNSAGGKAWVFADEIIVE